jgi:hypothetical protein
LLLGAFFVVALGTVIVDQADDYIYEVSRDPVVATITGHIGAGDALTPVNSVGERLQSNELNAPAGQITIRSP